MTFQLLQKQSCPKQIQGLSNKQQYHQSVKIIQKKDRYLITDLNHQVQLFPNLNVLLVKKNREYHYQ